jgi:glycosyltransferase involved in cell wall biosynthesis
VKLIDFKFSFPVRFSASAAMRRWLRSEIETYDALHVHSVYSVISIDAMRIAAQRGVPYILRPAGSLDKFDLRKKALIKYTMAARPVRKMLANSSAIHCTSQMEAQNMETFGAAVKTIVLPIPVTMPCQTGDGTRFRLTHNLAGRDFIWLFLSRIDYKKGLEILIPAFARLLVSFPHAKLVIAGADSEGYERKVRRWVEACGIPDAVVFCGLLQAQEKQDALAASDCFVLPSLNENFGVSIVEALGAEIPVVISENVYISKQISERNAGWICGYSTESLRETMANVMKNPAELLSKKRNAKGAAAMYSAEAVVQSYRNLYDTIGARKQ